VPFAPRPDSASGRRQAARRIAAYDFFQKRLGGNRQKFPRRLNNQEHVRRKCRQQFAPLGERGQWMPPNRRAKHRGGMGDVSPHCFAFAGREHVRVAQVHTVKIPHAQNAAAEFGRERLPVRKFNHRGGV
jgi:hypothetical protein